MSAGPAFLFGFAAGGTATILALDVFRAWLQRRWPVLSNRELLDLVRELRGDQPTDPAGTKPAATKGEK